MNDHATLGVWVSSTANPKDREIFLLFGGFPSKAEAEHARERAAKSFGEVRVISRDLADFRLRTILPRDEVEGMPTVTVSHLSAVERQLYFNGAVNLAEEEGAL